MLSADIATEQQDTAIAFQIFVRVAQTAKVVRLFQITYGALEISAELNLAMESDDG
jgi:hypothetical protein